MLKKAVDIIKLACSGQPDMSTDAGRSQDRYRRAARTTIVSIVTLAANVAVGLAIIPISLAYLGVDRFGLWMALTGFIGFLTCTDMGLGIGLQNALAECNGRDDRESPKSYISSAMLVMVAVATVVVAVALIVMPLLPLDRLIKTGTAEARAELLPTMQAMMICFAFGLPTAMALRIYNAYQRGYWGKLWQGTGRLIGLGGVLVCVWRGLSLPWLAACLMGVPFLVIAAGSLSMFRRERWLRPALGHVRPWAMRRIFRTGMRAVLVQVATVLLLAAPPLIIANRLGTKAVVPFAVTQRMCGMLGLVVLTVVMPMWPAYGEAATRGDWQWVRRTYDRTLRFAVGITIPFAIIVVLFGQQIIRAWTGNADAVPSTSLLIAMVVWASLQACCITLHAVTLNGLDRMTGQACYGPASLILGLALGYWMGGAYGVSGIVWSIVGVGVGLYSVGVVTELRRLLHKRAAL